MANQSTILFDPQLDERALDKETDKVNQELAGVGEDIPVNFEGEMPAMDGLSPAGAGGGGGGMGGEAAAFGAGRSGLASKIPKPMSGVAAASVLPVGIAGAVGAGMLSAMQGASARLQTSTSLLGQAWNNVWRPIGDKVDQLFIRDLALDLVSETQDLGQAIRNGDFLQGAFNIRDILFEGDSGNWLAAIVPGGLSIRLLEWFKNEITGVNWGALKDEIVGMWPGWPDVSGLWPGWPDVDGLWPGWPDIQPIELGAYVTGTVLGNHVTGVALKNFVTGINLGNFIDIPDFLKSGDPGGSTPTGPTNGNSGIPDMTEDAAEYWENKLPDDIQDQLDRPTDLISLNGGGRVTRSGVAEVHRGELVADPDRLVSELASAVSQASGGRTRVNMDTSEMERKLDTLNRNVRRLANALSVDGVGPEEIAQLSVQGRQERIADRDPTV